VYEWFTETSSLRFMDQATKLMHPKQAAKEEDIAEVIELWEEKGNCLARRGSEYHFPDVYRKVALNQMLVGKVRDKFDLCQAEKMPVEELLRKVRGQARSKKLDADASWGNAGFSVGSNNAAYPGMPHSSHEERGATDIGAFNRKGPKWTNKDKKKGKCNGEGR